MLVIDVSKRYIMQSKLDISFYDNNYYIKSPRGVIILNNAQYAILQEFKEENNISFIIDRYSYYGEQKIRNLLNKFLFEKLIVTPGSSFLETKTSGYIFRKLTKFNVSSKPFLFFVKGILSKLNITFVSVASLVLIVASIYFNIKLISYTGFSWNDVPRIWTFFLIGVIIAIYHELWMARFILYYCNEAVLKFKIRCLLGVFLSVVVDWEYLLLQPKKIIIKTFLKVDLITAGFCGFLSFIGYLFMIGGNKQLAFSFNCFSIIGYSYLCINLYPFLFKGDGYNIFCISNNVYRIRHYFFKLLSYKILRKPIDFIDKKKQWVYLLWGMSFIITLICIEYALVHGIRLRI